MANQADRDRILERLRPLVRPRSGIRFEVGDFLPESQTISQMYGNPYSETGEAWPLSPVDGLPLAFVFQIVNDGTINLDPRYGVVQLYYDFNAHPTAPDQPGWLIKTYPMLDPVRLTRLERPAVPELAGFTNVTARLRFEAERSLPELGDLGRHDPDLIDAFEALETEDDDVFDIYTSFCSELGVRELQSSSGVGGYPHWWQGDAWHRVETNGRCQLLVEINDGLPANPYSGFYLFDAVDQPGRVGFLFQAT